MDIVELKELASDLFAGGSALAGLILVFLGGILSAYDGFAPAARFAVRKKYRRRGALALAGFLAGLAGAALALIFKWLAFLGFLYASATCLALVFILIVILAIDAFGGLG
jgi:hypothetical protein